MLDEATDMLQGMKLKKKQRRPYIDNGGEPYSPNRQHSTLMYTPDANIISDLGYRERLTKSLHGVSSKLSELKISQDIDDDGYMNGPIGGDIDAQNFKVMCPISIQDQKTLKGPLGGPAEAY